MKSISTKTFHRYLMKHKCQVAFAGHWDRLEYTTPYRDGLGFGIVATLRGVKSNHWISEASVDIQPDPFGEAEYLAVLKADTGVSFTHNYGKQYARAVGSPG